MGELQRSEWTDAMRDHEREVARLCQAIARIDGGSATSSQGHEQRVYLMAQLTKHRISMALLASRLGVGLSHAH